MQKILKPLTLLKTTTFVWFAVGVVWFSSIIQTLLDYGDNPHFSVPIQTLVFFCYIMVGYFSLEQEKK